jgi:hypothetical protein
MKDFKRVHDGGFCLQFATAHGWRDNAALKSSHAGSAQRRCRALGVDRHAQINGGRNLVSVLDPRLPNRDCNAVGIGGGGRN